jgi:hypothetical protein
MGIKKGGREGEQWGVKVSNGVGKEKEATKRSKARKEEEK